MKRYNVLSAALVAMTLLTTQLPMSAQTTTSAKAKTTKTKRARKETPAEIQMREMREALRAQQDEINDLKAQISTKNGDVTAAQQTATEAQSQAAAAAASAAQAQAAANASAAKADAASSSVTSLQTTTANLNDTVVTSQKKLEMEMNEPAKLHYKGVTITPVAFFAFEGVWRQRSVNSGLNTPFNSIPFPGSNQGHVSELNFSGRQSRLGALFEGNAGSYKLSGYFEGDFLSSGTTSNSNQSNSYTLRQRQFWGQAATPGGFAVTGGQMWSLVTETGKGTDARTEKLPATIDPQYMVGFSWTRQPGIRIQKRFGDYKTGAFTLAASAENAQITGFTTAGAGPANYYFAGSGTGGGLYNATATYANNVAPDFVVKATFDNSFMHAEVGGLARFMRDYYYPILTANVGTGAYTYATKAESNTATAGGAFGSLRVSPAKFFDVAVQAMGGTGVGRYGSEQLADATLRPSGALIPIRNYHGLFTLETHPAKKLDVYAYYGGGYDQRTVYTSDTGGLMGYGPQNLNDTGCYALAANPGSNTGGSPSTANCASPTRYIQEGMIGFTYRLINSPKYGRFQYQATYQLIQRNLWSGIGNATTPTSPRAQDNMIHVSMRYYIP